VHPSSRKWRMKGEGRRKKGAESHPPHLFKKKRGGGAACLLLRLGRSGKRRGGRNFVGSLHISFCRHLRPEGKKRKRKGVDIRPDSRRWGGRERLPARTSSSFLDPQTKREERRTGFYTTVDWSKERRGGPKVKVRMRKGMESLLLKGIEKKKGCTVAL